MGSYRSPFERGPWRAAYGSGGDGGGQWPPRLQQADGTPSPFGWLARAVGAVVAVGLLVGALFLGAFVLTALLAVGFVGAVALRIWFWWKLRDVDRQGTHRMSGMGRGAGPYGAPRYGPRPDVSRAQGGDVVEGEYEVLDPDGAAEGTTSDDADRPRDG